VDRPCRQVVKLATELRKSDDVSGRHPLPTGPFLAMSAILAVTFSPMTPSSQLIPHLPPPGFPPFRMPSWDAGLPGPAHPRIFSGTKPFEGPTAIFEIVPRDACHLWLLFAIRIGPPPFVFLQCFEKQFRVCVRCVAVYTRRPSPGPICVQQMKRTVGVVFFILT